MIVARRGHCGHATGSLSSDESKEEVQCCFCGALAMRRVDYRDSSEGHGPYIPARDRQGKWSWPPEWPQENEGFCPVRNREVSGT
jgi:hypothetical protein